MTELDLHGLTWAHIFALDISIEITILNTKSTIFNAKFINFL